MDEVGYPGLLEFLFREDLAYLALVNAHKDGVPPLVICLDVGEAIFPGRVLRADAADIVGSDPGVVVFRLDVLEHIPKVINGECSHFSNLPLYLDLRVAPHFLFDRAAEVSDDGIEHAHRCLSRLGRTTIRLTRIRCGISVSGISTVTVILRYDLKGFSNRLKLICLLVFKLGCNVFKSPDRLGCIQSLSTMDAHTSLDGEKRGIASSRENLFYFLFNNLAAAVGTFLYVLHHGYFALCYAIAAVLHLAYMNSGSRSTPQSH